MQLCACANLYAQSLATCSSIKMASCLNSGHIQCSVAIAKPMMILLKHVCMGEWTHLVCESWPRELPLDL